MEPKLWELNYALEDAHESLDRAADLAASISGARPGRAAEPEHGIPADEGDEGWPLMNRLCDALVHLNVMLKNLREDPELVQAIAAERAEHDDLADRADAASY